MKYPNVAKMYTYCKRHLELKEHKEVKDKEIANLLNLDPSEITNWKKGKRDFKDVYKINKLCKKLNLDLEKIIEILCEEAL